MIDSETYRVIHELFYGHGNAGLVDAAVLNIVKQHQLSLAETVRPISDSGAEGVRNVIINGLIDQGYGIVHRDEYQAVPDRQAEVDRLIQERDQERALSALIFNAYFKVSTQLSCMDVVRDQEEQLSRAQASYDYAAKDAAQAVQKMEAFRGAIETEIHEGTADYEEVVIDGKGPITWEPGAMIIEHREDGRKCSYHARLDAWIFDHSKNLKCLREHDLLDIGGLAGPNAPKEDPS